MSGAQHIEHRPFGNIAVIQRIGTDLRFALDRASYGNILALTQEVGHYLSSVLDLLDTPDIKKSFDANTKWDVIEIVSNRHLGGARELSQRTKMAESGRRVLQYIADNEFKTGVNPVNFQLETQAVGSHAEAWIAAYRLTPKKGLSALTGLRCSRIQPASGASIAANGLASDIDSYCSRIGCRRCIHSAIGGGSPDPDAAIGAPNASATPIGPPHTIVCRIAFDCAHRMIATMLGAEQIATLHIGFAPVAIDHATTGAP